MDANNNIKQDVEGVGDPEEGPIIQDWNFVIEGVHALQPDRNPDTISTVAYSIGNSDPGYHHEIPAGHIIPQGHGQASLSDTSADSSILNEYRHTYRCR